MYFRKYLFHSFTVRKITVSIFFHRQNANNLFFILVLHFCQHLTQERKPLDNTEAIKETQLDAISPVPHANTMCQCVRYSNKKYKWQPHSHIITCSKQITVTSYQPQCAAMVKLSFDFLFSECQIFLIPK